MQRAGSEKHFPRFSLVQRGPATAIVRACSHDAERWSAEAKGRTNSAHSMLGEVPPQHTSEAIA